MQRLNVRSIHFEVETEIFDEFYRAMPRRGERTRFLREVVLSVVAKRLKEQRLQAIAKGGVEE